VPLVLKNPHFLRAQCSGLRDFYLAYAEHSKLQPLVAEISWAKNLVIFTRCKDELEREFYLRATARFGWTKAVRGMIPISL
jgi:hypothetical protein